MHMKQRNIRTLLQHIETYLNKRIMGNAYLRIRKEKDGQCWLSFFNTIIDTQIKNAGVS